MSEDREVIQHLFNALSQAKSHLEFCGYGDKHEHKCAEAIQLPKRIDRALETAAEKGFKPSITITSGQWVV